MRPRPTRKKIDRGPIKGSPEWHEMVEQWEIDDLVNDKRERERRLKGPSEEARRLLEKDCDF